MKENNIFSHEESAICRAAKSGYFSTKKLTENRIEIVGRPDIGCVSRHRCPVQVVRVGQEVVDFVVGERVVPQERDLVPV